MGDQVQGIPWTLVNSGRRNASRLTYVSWRHKNRPSDSWQAQVCCLCPMNPPVPGTVSYVLCIVPLKPLQHECDPSSLLFVPFSTTTVLGGKVTDAGLIMIRYRSSCQCMLLFPMAWCT